MDYRVRVSPEQLVTLLEYMETHGDLAKALGVQGRIRSDRLWSELTNILNAVGGGVSKTTDKWKKVWADWKSKTKKKGLAIRQHTNGTGGGPARRQTLSAIEERVLAVKGALAVEGESSVKELGFNRSQSPAQNDLLTVDDTVYLEIIDETSHLPSPSSLPSPQSSTSTQPSKSWLLLSTSSQVTLPPFPLMRSPRSSQGRQPAAPSPVAPPSPPAPEVPAPPSPPAPPAPTAPAPPSPPAPAAPAPQSSPAPAAPAPPSPAAPTTPRRRQSPATPPSARRHLRLSSLAKPQAAGFPGRPRLRGRRWRQAPTPIERAASEFAAVELRRLEIEETRIRLQHERDLRALEVEHERIDVFRSLVNIARAGLDYYRSRDNTEPVKIE